MVQSSKIYRIQKVLSNNVLQVQDDCSSQEFILMGKGIGFGRKSGEEIAQDYPSIEKKYALQGSEDQSEVTLENRSVLEHIHPDVQDVSRQIIALIVEEFATTDLNEQVFIALPSHIQFAITRLNNNINIVNPFWFEIQALHTKEYALAQKAAELLESKFHVSIPDAEIGFLTMHIQSAVCHLSVGNIVLHNQLVLDLVEQIEKALHKVINRNGMDYIRLITHLRFAIERITESKSSSNPFAKELKTTLPEEYRLAKQLAGTIETSLEKSVSEDELGYLVMHLHRLFLVG
ncbi:PRD domain-containing protein [Paenibacillus albiflavus]|uniref:PRD domain-containing protein n=1 Tax=Paenibacillus albiflavus TaxID=2545760 RepID=A0A4R4E3D5_9BACL|nr:PRD domain-containing protein [Paenibacillus albiflavus]TCZ73427.1 PRD domain-containing protein [Paenibacillus albiflavus]